MSQFKAVLALEDGTTFSGRGFGAPGVAVGEVVFNTAMTGYQEILTDPSYTGQLVTLTVPHVGNTGVNAADMESARTMAAGLITRHYPRRTSSWRAEETLAEWLVEHGVTAISDVDTRALTTRLREKGALNGCILVSDSPDPEEALERARACPPMAGQDLAARVSTPEPYAWDEGLLDLDDQNPGPESRVPGPESRIPKLHVVCYDYGVKRNILRMLVAAGCRVTVVPAQWPVTVVMELEPDGVLLSNGPGDPEPCDYAVAAIGDLLACEIPVFGICLGHQLLALAAGAKTIKMKFGHHGANHPVKDLESGRVMISSQNHGFAVDEETLPEGVVPTHRSLFDGSLQGIRFTDRRAFGFQGHPEASPGPHDLRPLFARFVRLMSDLESESR